MIANLERTPIGVSPNQKKKTRHTQWEKQQTMDKNTRIAALEWTTAATHTLLSTYGGFFVDPFCYLCLVSVMLSCLFVEALWSLAGKGLASWLSCVRCPLCFVTFPCGALGRVWRLIVSVPDLCLLPYIS